MTELTGTQILLECWKKEAVEVVFGYPGAATIDIHHHMAKSGIKFVLTRHEQAAVHAAEGYARVSGRPGIVLVTSGPGATNTVTGIAGANMDSIPLIVFTGQVARMMIGNDAFQEVDIVGITRPVTKHNYLVRDTDSLAKTLKEAFHLAVSGRPGAILVDLPKDILTGKTKFHYPNKVHLKAYQPHFEAHPKQVEKALSLLKEAKRPIIYAGGGVISSGANEQLLQLAESLSIPVTNTLMGLGGFPGEHPLFIGMLGMHGLYKANMAIQNADLILAIGARFDDRVTGPLDKFAKKAKIIQIDIDPTSIHKVISTDIPLVADAQRALSSMLELLGKKPDYDKQARQKWLDQIAQWDKSSPLCYDNSNSNEIKPQMVIERLYEKTKGQAIVTTEVGQHQMWTAQYYKFSRPRQFITSGGLGVMGFGLPAALGAILANPNATVIDIAGDGSILMNIQELVTAVEYKLPVKIAILNNACLGMVRQWQELFYDKTYADTLLTKGPDFIKLAEAFGAKGFRATKPSEVDQVIEKALNTDGPVIMDFIVSPEECVYPMVPAGNAIDQMLLSSPEKK